MGDFLGLDKPLRPGGATTLPARPGERPGIADRPGIDNRPGNRPGIDNRPGNRPVVDNRPGNRPGFNDRFDRRPDFRDRDRWGNNNIINNRPSWANIGNDVNVNVSNRWNNAFTNVNNRGWWDRPAGRRGYWNGWADGVRHSWGHYHHHDHWFSNNWWNNHSCNFGGWNYGYYNRPASYWWTVPVWGNLTSWFTWSAPATVWQQPVYYDYGTGGNVTYENNYVYIGGEQVATTDEFAQTAMDLATVPPPETEEQAQQAEWMPLGTFAVSTGEKDVEPSMTVQLAVDKTGIVSGTLYHIDTDQTQAVQGAVDKQTQRVAIRFGESNTVVAETGLYNLTQDEVPVLVHFGTDQVENYLLVRLEQPDSEGVETTTGG